MLRQRSVLLKNPKTGAVGTLTGKTGASVAGAQSAGSRGPPSAGLYWSEERLPAAAVA